jgi:hypothetical protein
MAEKIISGDSLQNEFVAKFNGMADEVNALKESGGSGGAIIELSGESGTLTDEQYAQCILPNTTIKWQNGSGGNMIYEPWRFISPTYYFKSVYIDADECINNIIEIDQISQGWKRKSTTCSGNGSGGSVVSVKQTLTSGTEIGSITVNGTETKLYAPESIIDTTPINYVNALPTENIKTNEYYLVIDTVQSWVGGVLNQMPNPSDYFPDMLSGIPITVNMVDTLPSTGEYATDDYNAPTKIVLYYQKSDMELYAYMPEGKVPTTGETNLGNTWQKANVFLIGGFYITYRGFISSGDESEALQGHNNLYLFVSGERYRYKGGSWQKVEAGSGANAIIDVESLPTEGINENAFYRISGTASIVARSIPVGVNVKVYYVYTLPTNGIPIDPTTGYLPIYYQKSDNSVYYLTTNGEAWRDGDELFSIMGVSYGGIITSLEEIEDTALVYILVDHNATKLYHYKNGWHEIGGNSESSITGMSIKQITFTDRPTLWAWLQINYYKIMKLTYTFPATPVKASYNTITPSFDDNNELINCTFSSFFPIILENGGAQYGTTYIMINDTHVEMLAVAKLVTLNNEDGIHVDGTTVIEASDIIWSQLGLSVIVYYIE